VRIENLLRSSELRRYSRNAIVFKEGEILSELYIVKSGEFAMSTMIKNYSLKRNFLNGKN